MSVFSYDEQATSAMFFQLIIMNMLCAPTFNSRHMSHPKNNSDTSQYKKHSLEISIDQHIYLYLLVSTPTDYLALMVVFE